MQPYAPHHLRSTFRIPWRIWFSPMRSFHEPGLLPASRRAASFASTSGFQWKAAAWRRALAMVRCSQVHQWLMRAKGYGGAMAMHQSKETPMASC